MNGRDGGGIFFKSNNPKSEIENQKPQIRNKNNESRKSKIRNQNQKTKNGGRTFDSRLAEFQFSDFDF